MMCVNEDGVFMEKALLLYSKMACLLTEAKSIGKA